MNKQKTVYFCEPDSIPPGRIKKQCHCGKWFVLPRCHAYRHTSCSAECKKDKAYEIKKRRERACATCGALFIPRNAQVSAGQGRYCSSSCAIPALIKSGHTPESRTKAVATWHANGNTVPSGPDNKLFIGRKLLDGYVYVWVNGRGYTAEHRLVAESIIGRKLSRLEVVHHINHIRTDNRPENLAVMSRSKHLQEHKKDIFNARRVVKRVRGNKLTIDSAASIKKDLRNGLSRTEIAIRYGITCAMVSSIVNGKSWAHA